MKIGFVVWNPFMVYHMKGIAESIVGPEFLILDYQQKIDVLSLFGENPGRFIGHDYRIVQPDDMPSLDGDFNAMVCPNPFAGMENLERTQCIGMQYSMAKDRYVNAPWRAMFDLTLTYGRYSAERIASFCPTAMVGNPRFDRWFSDRPNAIESVPLELDRDRRTLLYLPTWGEFSSVDTFMDTVVALSDKYNVLVKVHHKTETHEARRREAVAQHRVVRYFGATDDLLPLLKCADVVLSDYSGAIFDAIYVRKPVILLQTDPASVIGRKFGFESIEYARRDDIGPVVATPSELDATVASVISGQLDFEARNAALRSEIFEYDHGSGAVAARAILSFLAERPERPLYQQYLQQEQKALRRERAKLRSDVRTLKERLAALTQKLNLIEHDPVALARHLRARDSVRNGNRHVNNRRWRQAAEEYQAALRYDPTCSEWYTRLGYVLEQDERWQEAASAYESAIRYFGK